MYHLISDTGLEALIINTYTGQKYRLTEYDHIDMQALNDEKPSEKTLVSLYGWEII